MTVYLPVLLLIPDYFRLPIDGFPDPTFSQCAILPIGIAVLWKAVIRWEWNFSWLDFWILAYALWQFVSDFYNVGYRDAQNLFFDVVTLSLLPYICGKVLIESEGFRTAFARRFVWLLFLVGVISTYEFRMGESLFRPGFVRFFPGQDPAWFTQLRWGFGRIAGPLSHSILMGCILSTALLMCVWLARSGHWEPEFRWLGKIPFSKPQSIGGGLLIAMLMTLSRGPWLGAVFGVVIAAVGSASNYKRAMRYAVVLLVILGALTYVGGKVYIESTKEVETRPGVHFYNETEEVQSLAYRERLIDQYVAIAMQRPLWGWGRANWPTVPGLASVDNNYLFIALNTGLTGVAFFVAILAVGFWRLFASGFVDESLAPQERSFHFTLIGVILAVAVTTTTVYLGSQLYPLLFLFLGWADGCVIQRSAQVSAMARLQRNVSGLQTVRVLA